MKILVIEDERELADGLAVLLERNGYSAEVCRDGEEGLSYLLTGLYDAVILDIMLPGIDGISVLRNARAQGNTTPIILLTARDQLEDKVNGLDCGADDYITKPFDAEELIARIRARTRTEFSRGVSDYFYGDIQLDRSRQELRCGSRRIKIAHKEYELMEYLIMNAGRIISKDVLISRVWPPDKEPEYNHLEVYISFLRKKLRFVHARTVIVTTKNVGYSLEYNAGAS